MLPSADSELATAAKATFQCQLACLIQAMRAWQKVQVDSVHFIALQKMLKSRHIVLCLSQTKEKRKRGQGCPESETGKTGNLKTLGATAGADVSGAA